MRNNWSVIAGVLTVAAIGGLAGPGIGEASAVGCGDGPIFAEQLTEFTHRIIFTIETGDNVGYLVDCSQYADFFADYRAGGGTSWWYLVSGQIGDYQ